MRIVIADYSGHPFQVQLSRELARRGHQVLHLYFADFQTPRGRLEIGPGDPPTLAIEAISLGRPFAKHSFVKRRFQEIGLGRLFANRIAAFGADVVVGSNLPLDSLRAVARACARSGCAFVFWQQDIYSIAIARIMTEKLGLPGTLIGKHYKAIERGVLKSSQAVIVISHDFITALRDTFGIAGENMHVVENWAPLDEIVPRPKDNVWARTQGLIGKQIVLYTGTLGMKHDPRQILAAAAALRLRPDTQVIVISEGPAADWLAAEARSRNLPGLRVLGFQPFRDYPDVLGSADVLISILDRDCGVFSVPSKVLSYLCAGRAIVLSAAPENLASRIVRDSGAGLVVPAGDSAKFTDAIIRLLDDCALRDEAGRNARHYAQKTFDVAAIGDRFEAILSQAAVKG